MSVKKRLKEFIKETGLTVQAWEKSINVSNGYVNGMVKGIGEDKILIILEVYPNLNFDWLMTGRGKMLISNNNTYQDTIEPDCNIATEEQAPFERREITNNEIYWRGRYDELLKQYERLLNK